MLKGVLIAHVKKICFFDIYEKNQEKQIIYKSSKFHHIGIFVHNFLLHIVSVILYLS